MISVLGSINTDLVVRVPRFPAPGETLSGSDVGIYSGGKGANQAVAAARLGAEVRLFGKVGDDVFGDRLLAELLDHRVDVNAVERESGCASGLASIWVDHAGENSIVLAAGANGKIDDAYIDRHCAAICQASVVLLQLEIPLDAIVRVLSRLPKNRPTVILDPAPACDLSTIPLDRLDIITPNEHELRLIAGEENVERGAFRLLDLGVRNVICTLGSAGAVWFASDGAIAHFSAPEVRVVDTTAAGDAFNGALAWALQTCSLEESIAYGVRAGALATTKEGAQASLPDQRDLGVFGPLV